MFAKILALGLGALAVARAAPAAFSQNVMLSCSVNLDVSAPPAKSFNAIEPGEYMIFNKDFGSSPIRTYGVDRPVFAIEVGEWPGPFGFWRVDPSGGLGSNEYTMTNVRLNTGTHVNSENKIVTIPGKGDRFSIEPAGDNTFTIKVPNEDLVWTVDTEEVMAPVYLKHQDGVATRWTLVRVLKD
ncbi:hypothetical protein C8R45DRAFT_1211245 [Mycena sanguinolenta]|nr:hypothetical protein C8R45DRAFT_1211245 [Mycena sanguinolenta]